MMNRVWMKVAAMGAAVVLGVGSGLADSYYKGGDVTWGYQVFGDKAFVTSWISSSPQTYLLVPSKIDGYSVSSVTLSSSSGSDYVESVYIPSGVATLVRCNNFSNLTSVFLPSSLTIIGDWAFYNCTKLRSISIPDGVTGLGGSVFQRCCFLTSVSLPLSLTSLGDSAFYDCTNLTSVTIPSKVRTIGAFCFVNCGKLTKVVVPDSVCTIGQWAFGFCEKLASITLPSGLQKLNGSTFRFVQAFRRSLFRERWLALASLNLPTAQSSRP